MDHHPSGPSALAATTRRWLIRSLLAITLALASSGCGSPDYTALDDDQASGSGSDQADAPGDEAATDGSEVADGGVDSSAVGDDGAVDEPEPVAAADPASIDLIDATPAEVVAEVAAEMERSGATGSLLDAVAPIDAAVPGEPDGRPRNEMGELVELDEPAELACAQVEIAIGDLDEGDLADATEGVVTASGNAGRSAIADIRAWGSPLEDASAESLDEPATLIGFLSICVEGGYEL